MSPDLLKALAFETKSPRGVAARVDSQDLKLLLDEREDLLAALRALRLEALHHQQTGRGSKFLDAAIARAGEEIELAGKP